MGKLKPSDSTLSRETSASEDSSISTKSAQQDKLRWFKDFRSHFDLWVVEPIDRLVDSKDALIGFIFMSCTIDYLAGFWWGSSTRNNVKKAYTGFIEEYFPSGRYNAEGLYDSLRNGLVHMFTIKNKKYTLTHNNPDLHLKSDRNQQIILNAGNFRNDLIAAKDKYFDDVENDISLLDNVVNRYTRDGFLKLTIIQT